MTSLKIWRFFLTSNKNKLLDSEFEQSKVGGLNAKLLLKVNDNTGLILFKILSKNVAIFEELFS